MRLGGVAPTIIVQSIYFRFAFVLLSLHALNFLNNIIIPALKKPKNKTSKINEYGPKCHAHGCGASIGYKLKIILSVKRKIYPSTIWSENNK
jgi:hypothetical protein